MGLERPALRDREGRLAFAFALGLDLRFDARGLGLFFFARQAADRVLRLHHHGVVVALLLDRVDRVRRADLDVDVAAHAGHPQLELVLPGIALADLFLGKRAHEAVQRAERGLHLAQAARAFRDRHLAEVVHRQLERRAHHFPERVLEVPEAGERRIFFFLLLGLVVGRLGGVIVEIDVVDHDVALGLRRPPGADQQGRAVLGDVGHFRVEERLELHVDGILGDDALEDFGHLVEPNAQVVDELVGEFLALLERVAEFELRVLCRQRRQAEREHQSRHQRAFHIGSPVSLGQGPLGLCSVHRNRWCRRGVRI